MGIVCKMGFRKVLERSLASALRRDCSAYATGATYHKSGKTGTEPTARTHLYVLMRQSMHGFRR